MFWKYNTLTASHLDTLLDKQGVTLAEILEQEDIIQECKTQNKKLVDYLTKPEILSELLDLILQEPPVDLEESLRFKLPNIASELITCDVPQINEKLSSDTTLLDKMYAFLEGPPPLNPLLTSFFSKAFGVLITRRSEQNWYSYQYTCLQVIEYIKVKEGFTGLLLTHIATSAVMDLVLRLITCVDGTENKQNILTWLNDERLIQRVLSLLAPPGDGGGGEKVEGAEQARAEQNDNVGQLLVEIIRVSRDAHITATPTERFHNPLLATAESPETVHQLLGYMVDGPAVESTIVNGVDVLLSLLEIRRPAPQGGGFYSYTTDQDQTPNQAEIDRQQAVLESTVECIIPRLPQLTALLLSPPHKPPIRTTCGVLEPPLGRTRLSLAKLFAALLSTNHAPLNLTLANANTTTILLDLFFKYSLNNFLHAQVESCVHSIIFWKEKAELNLTQENMPTPDIANTSSLQTSKISETGTDEAETEESKEKEENHPLKEMIVDNPALVHLMSSGRLLDRLIATWQATNLSPMVSYMGHVTRITNDLVMAMGEDTVPPSQSRTLLLQLLAQLPEETQASWRGLVAGRLKETNELNEVKPAAEVKRTMSSDDEDSDFRDIQFPHDSALQQMQEMSDNFIDSFGFHDDEFTESDENVSRGMRKLNSVNFLMQTDDSTKQAIFDSVCEQRIKAFNSDEDPWADKTAEISFGGAGGRARQGSERDKANEELDSSDEENEPAPDKMEVDNDQDPWESNERTVPTGGPVAMDTSSPWGGQVESGGSGASAGEETGWANFATFTTAGGEGMGDMGPSGSDDPGDGMDSGGEREEGWEPAMASSPEATMLDCTPTTPGGSEITNSPSLLSRLAAPPDIADTNANPAPVPSDSQGDSDGDDGERSSGDHQRLAGGRTDKDHLQDGEDVLTDNFSFLAARGLISRSSDSSDCDPTSTSGLPSEADIRPNTDVPPSSQDHGSQADSNSELRPTVSDADTDPVSASQLPEASSSEGDPPPST